MSTFLVPVPFFYRTGLKDPVRPNHTYSFGRRRGSVDVRVGVVPLGRMTPDSPSVNFLDWETLSLSWGHY